MQRLVGFLVLSLVSLLFGAEALAAKYVTPFGLDRPVAIEDFRPHLMGNEGYTEEWSHGVWMEDGSFLGVDFMISNLGMGDHNGAVVASYIDPQRRETKCKSEYDDDEWSSAKTGFSLKYGNNELQGDLQGLRLTIRCQQLSADLRLENELPPWRPGGGRLRFGEDDGDYWMMFTSPRAKVTGKIVLGGQTREIQGVGHAAHSYSTAMLNDQVHRWFRFKSIKPELSIILAEMEASSDYGNATNGWVMILDSNGRIAATARVNFQYEGLIQDTQSDEGYKIPRRVRIVALDGDAQVTGVLTMKSLKEKKDPTQDLDGVRRAIVRRFTKPMKYEINCSYEIRVKTGSGDRVVQGEGTFSFVYVNP